MKLSLLIGLVLGLAASFDNQAAAAVQSQLREKSLVISWREARVQRKVGEEAFRNFSASHTLRVYFSSAGRTFSRLTNSAQIGSGSRDIAPTDTGNVSANGSGNNLTLLRGGNSGGAHRFSISFEGNFQNCHVQVVRAKEIGKSSMFATSVINGNRIEIKSVETSAETCSVQNGNVFVQ